MPYEDLTLIASKSVIDNYVNPEDLHTNAFRAIYLLEQGAKFGNESAIKSLVVIGRQVTGILQFLSGQPDDDIDKAIKDARFFPEDQIRNACNCESKTTPTSLESDINILLEAPRLHLEKTLNEISKKTPIPLIKLSIKDLLANKSQPDHEAKHQEKGNARSEAAMNLENQRAGGHQTTSWADLLTFCEKSLQTASIDSSASPSTLPQDEDNEEPRFLSSQLKPADFDMITGFSTCNIENGITPAAINSKLSSNDLVKKLFQCLVTTRIAHVSRRIVRRIAGNSSAWPISVSAIADKRTSLTETYVKYLNLGSSLPIRANPKPGKGGARDMRSESKISFTLQVVEYIYRKTAAIIKIQGIGIRSL